MSRTNAEIIIDTVKLLANHINEEIEKPNRNVYHIGKMTELFDTITKDIIGVDYGLNVKVIEIMDYENNRKPVLVNNDYELHIDVISGDEVLTITTPDGKTETIDSCDERIIDFRDGGYDLDINADYYEDWAKAKTSYERQNIVWERG